MNIRKLAVGIALTAAAANAAEDVDLNALPPEQHQGAVTFRSGGIGQAESKAMQAARSQYSLSLSFYSREAGKTAFTSDVHVSIRSADGSEVLETVSDGPFLLVNLPRGKYHVVAQALGDALVRDVTVEGRHVDVNLEWTNAPQ